MATHTGRVSIFPSAAVTDKRLGSAAFRVLAALGRHGDKNGWCFPSQKTLADDLGITRQAVSKSIQQLVALGYVTIKEQHRADGSRSVNLYRVVLDFDESPPQPDVDTPQLLEVDTPQPDVDTPQPLEVAALTSHRNSPIRTTHQDHTRQTPPAAKRRTLTTQQQARFDRWYAAYPKRAHRLDAERAWQRLDPDDDLTELLLADIPARLEGRKWADGYIEDPARYLNQYAWEDDIEPVAAERPRRQADHNSAQRGKVVV